MLAEEGFGLGAAEDALGGPHGADATGPQGAAPSQAALGALAGQSGTLGHGTANAVLVVTIGSIVLAPIALACLRWVFSRGRSRAGYAVPSGGSATA